MPDTLSLRALNRALLARQMLLQRADLSPRAALERLAGLQAQWPKLPFIALWSRLNGFEREDLAVLLRKRQAVRATMMRGTIHVATTPEFVRMRSVLQPVLTRGLAPVRKKAANIDMDKVVRAARSLFAQPHTFEEVRTALVAQFPEYDDRAMGHIARMVLPLVMVPTDNPWAFPAVSRFQLAEAWLGKPLAATSDPTSLVMRYFAAFGPATVADAQAWSGLQGLRPLVDSLRPKLTTFRDGRGRELFDVPDGPRPDEDTPAPVRFLPEFDNVLLGFQDRSRVIAAEFRPFVFLSGLRVTSTVLVDGFVAATWKIESAKKRTSVVVQLLAKQPKRVVNEIAAEAEQVARFVEPDAVEHDVQWT